jgi:predicted outer membrane lipoprotein
VLVGALLLAMLTAFWLVHSELRRRDRVWQERINNRAPTDPP